MALRRDTPASTSPPVHAADPTWCVRATGTLPGTREGVALATRRDEPGRRCRRRRGPGLL